MKNASTLERPWEGLPREVAAVFRPELPALAEEILVAIRENVPDYARPLEGPFGAGLRIGVERALGQFVEVIERPTGERGGSREVYVALGRGEAREQRSLNALLSAYRLGARVAWRRLVATGAAAGLSPETLYLLAESIFAYIDELSAESAEGYTQEQSAAAGEAQRRRRRLVSLLVQDPLPDTAIVEAAARDARWDLPRSLAALVLEGEEPDRLAGRVGRGAIAAQDGPLVVVLVPDPEAPTRRAELAAALAGTAAALGPTVSWPGTATSFARATAALRLAGEGVLAPASPLVASEHAAALLIHGDRPLAHELAEDRLAPLAALSPRSRERMAETLLAWLQHQGRLPAVAEALHVHPQTVRYRLERLRELFGDDLEDPEGRFAIEIALRVGRRPSALTEAGVPSNGAAPTARD